MLEFAQRLWHQDATGLFFLDASNGYLPGPFVTALTQVGFRVVPLTGSASEKVLDIGIRGTLEALVDRDADVLLGSHDRDYLDQVEHLLDTDHRVGILGFPELVSGAYAGLDVHLFDLEADVKASNTPLPRVRIIPHRVRPRNVPPRGPSGSALAGPEPRRVRRCHIARRVVQTADALSPGPTMGATGGWGFRRRWGTYVNGAGRRWSGCLPSSDHGVHASIRLRRAGVARRR